MDPAPPGGLAGSDCRGVENLYDCTASWGLLDGLLYGLCGGGTESDTSGCHCLSSSRRYFIYWL